MGQRAGVLGHSPHVLRRTPPSPLGTSRGRTSVAVGRRRRRASDAKRRRSLRLVPSLQVMMPLVVASLLVLIPSMMLFLRVLASPGGRRDGPSPHGDVPGRGRRRSSRSPVRTLGYDVVPGGASRSPAAFPPVASIALSTGSRRAVVGAASGSPGAAGAVAVLVVGMAQHHVLPLVLALLRSGRRRGLVVGADGGKDGRRPQLPPPYR
mmetsp:Transcript_6444/g.14066  ORF Transcript_6444/g.14066 Transcript_6444/m.14066 type:complete len:208 (-) Transcript_6444:843-1466(-)